MEEVSLEMLVNDYIVKHLHDKELDIKSFVDAFINFVKERYESDELIDRVFWSKAVFNGAFFDISRWGFQVGIDDLLDAIAMCARKYDEYISCEERVYFRYICASKILYICLENFQILYGFGKNMWEKDLINRSQGVQVDSSNYHLCPWIRIKYINVAERVLTTVNQLKDYYPSICKIANMDYLGLLLSGYVEGDEFIGSPTRVFFERAEIPDVYNISNLAPESRNLRLKYGLDIEKEFYDENEEILKKLKGEVRKLKCY